MLVPANYYVLHQELCVFVYRPVKKLPCAPLSNVLHVSSVISNYVNGAKRQHLAD